MPYRAANCPLRVPRLLKLVALFLVALWLPATMHCAMEAAGVTRGDHHSSSCQDMCKDDTCHTIEGVSFTKTSNTLRALPPAVSSLYLCLLNLLPPPVLVDQSAANPAGDPPEIQALDHTWQFARRAALPARAPDVVA